MDTDTQSTKTPEDERNTVNTTTSQWDITGGQGIPENPVAMLYRTDTKEMWELDDLRWPELSIGAGDHNDIVLRNSETVSWQHCELLRTDEERVYIKVSNASSKRYIKLNRARVVSGELGSGDVVRLGKVELIAFGVHQYADSECGIKITADNLQEYLERSSGYYRTRELAARALNVPWSTFHGWLQKRKFAKS